MKMLFQDLDAKGGQLKETGEKLALTSARWLQELAPLETNIFEGDIFFFTIFTMFTMISTCRNQYL